MHSEGSTVMTKRVLSVLGVLLLAGCGDDDGGGTEVESGLPADAKLSSLDSGDAQKLCKSMADSFNDVLSDDDLKKISCVVLAVPLSIKAGAGGEVEGDIPKCKDLVSRCMKGETISSEDPEFAPPEEFVAESECSAASVSDNFEGCEANVGEFESCASGMLSSLSDRFDIFDCETLRDPKKLLEMDSEGLDLESNPRCEALYEKCPNIDFGTEEEETIED
jgi:hypothetical protein